MRYAPPLHVERPDRHDSDGDLRFDPRGNGAGNVDDIGGARFASGIGRGDVVVPAWAWVYNERVGLPLTTGYPMLKNRLPSTSRNWTEVQASGAKLVDGLAPVANEADGISRRARRYNAQLARRWKRKENGGEC